MKKFIIAMFAIAMVSGCAKDKDNNNTNANACWNQGLSPAYFPGQNVNYINGQQNRYQQNYLQPGYQQPGYVQPGYANNNINGYQHNNYQQNQWNAGNVGCIGTAPGQPWNGGLYPTINNNGSPYYNVSQPLCLINSGIDECKERFGENYVCSPQQNVYVWSIQRGGQNMGQCIRFR